MKKIALVLALILALSCFALASCGEEETSSEAESKAESVVESAAESSEAASEALEKMDDIMEAKDRKKAGFTAPPQGLFLEKVEY